VVKRGKSVLSDGTTRTSTSQCAQQRAFHLPRIWHTGEADVCQKLELHLERHALALVPTRKLANLGRGFVVDWKWGFPYLTTLLDAVNVPSCRTRGKPSGARAAAVASGGMRSRSRRRNAASRWRFLAERTSRSARQMAKDSRGTFSAARWSKAPYLHQETIQ
jgi:hypothetical protein